MRTIACTVLAISTLYPSTVSALDVTAAALVGYGLSPEQDDDAPRPVGYDAGFGARAGVTLPFRLHVGATFVYHVGASFGHQEISSNVWYAGGESGYDFEAGPVTIRPYLGFGYARTHKTPPLWCPSGPCGEDVPLNEGLGALWPGAAAFVDVARFVTGSRIFVGADLRYVILLERPEEGALSAFLTAGIGF